MEWMQLPVELRDAIRTIENHIKAYAACGAATDRVRLDDIAARLYDLQDSATDARDACKTV